jgi:hypothetical protein
MNHIRSYCHNVRLSMHSEGILVKVYAAVIELYFTELSKKTYILLIQVAQKKITFETTTMNPKIY